MPLSRQDTSDYQQLFLRDRPLLDVRAPVEFALGAFPTARNLPLMNDMERHRIGLRYKEQGQDAAIALGHQLVEGELKDARLEQWLAFAHAHPDGFLYCFRGGLRSRTSQQWLAEAGIDYPLVQGGYKAMRRFLLDDFASRVDHLNLVLISGRTGSGKTRLLPLMPRSLDLEAMAEHRGSSFGRTLTPQPSQIDFENRLYIALLKSAAAGEPLWLEDEGHLIGRCALPLALNARMKAAPLMVLEEPRAVRVEIILQDYVIDMSQAFMQRDGAEPGFAAFRHFLLGSLERVHKRLGGERYQRLAAIMGEALDAQSGSADLDGHRLWIEQLLTHYYDPMYDYQLSRKAGPILARGDHQTLAEKAARLTLADTVTTA
ncbi:MAG: tRNA 2-selenouridine(34) synthase MnmH [Halomonadaceae bacterium]|nr:MAG: tRNA 2-selenouridine(34) synthase MnmH [Halomonadaceae bacterium]